MAAPQFSEADAQFMQRALELAEQAGAAGEVPVGAVLVRAGQIIGEGSNQPITLSDPTAHAEIQALRAAGVATGNYRFPDAALYVTLEPCMMCLGALVHARVTEIVFGAEDPKSGVLGSAGQLAGGVWLNHHCASRGGLLADDAGSLLRAFFRARR